MSIKFISQYQVFYLTLISSVVLSIVLAFTNSLWWLLLASFVWAKIVHFVFLQIGLHRYFAHNSFTTGRYRHLFLAAGSILTGQGSPITWSINHLYHHKNSDTDQDIHSPKHGWLHTALLWPLQGKAVGISPKHLVKDKPVMWIHNHYFSIWTVLFTLTLIIDWKFCLYGLVAPAGWSLLYSNIVGYLINHSKFPGSYQTFETGDNSWNNKWVQCFQIGEGLHNNHHYNMKAYNQAMRPGEFDPAAKIVDIFFKK
jgi:stearoyl-CoA desaturase (delta-9 desaturase)